MLDFQQKGVNMNDYLDILETIELFNGINKNEIAELLPCLSAKHCHYKSDEIIFLSNQQITKFGIVLFGEVQIIHEDYYGNRNILTKLTVGNLFGESFACSPYNNLPVNVIAASDVDVLLIECPKVTKTCKNCCDYHNRLIQNLLGIIAKKNILLNQKLEILSKRTTKDKLLAYLSYEAKRLNNNQFSIPFNRQELADYLGVERSAMSVELSKLKNEGLLDYNRNDFKI